VKVEKTKNPKERRKMKLGLTQLDNNKLMPNE